MDTPIWHPVHPENSNMAQFMRFAEQTHPLIFHDYQALYKWSIQEPASFWETLARFFKLTFTTPPQHILTEHEHMIQAQWFQGATFNFAEKLLQRNDNHPALISLNESGQRDVLTFQQLKACVADCAAGMKKFGINPGDRVAGILCHGKHAIINMLATTSLGAIWSSCSPDFGAEALLDRFGQIEPKLLFICDGYTYQGKTYLMQEKINALLEALPTLEQCVICPNLSPQASQMQTANIMSWDNFLIPNSQLTFTAFPFNHPLYILFSSGTTGQPKCILHGAGGTLLQHLKELSLHSNLSSNDILFFYTTCGWMMWNWMASALALGTTLILYDGSPVFPKKDHLFEIIAAEHVNVFGTSPKYIASIEHANIHPKQHACLSDLRCILSTGSPLLPNQYDFVKEHISSSVQLASISGGTDIISCFALGNPISPIYRGEIQCLGLGMKVQVFDDEGQPIQETIGELVCTAPFPSMPIGFWNDPSQAKYKHAYFERFAGIWAHGDFAEITRHQGLIIHGRSDTTLNPGGVRIGTAEIYRQLDKVPEIIDSVVIGQDWNNDTRIVLFVTLSKNTALNQTLKNKIRETLRNHASARHVPAKIIAVPDIPRTMNGKTVEMAVRQAVHGQAISQLSSLANPETLVYFRNRAELAID
jgi:acetoacetyl-CoA synthetase